MLRFAMEPVLIVIFMFVVVIVLINNRAKERQSRLKVLEEALKNGNLDERTRQDLVDALSDRPRSRAPHQDPPQPTPAAAYSAPAAPAPAPPRSSGMARFAFAIGWLSLFLGIALLAMDDRDCFYAGMIVAFSGFALMSLPIAVRELDREKPEKSSRRV